MTPLSYTFDAHGNELPVTHTAEDYMRKALEQAQKAYAHEEVPIGAIAVHKGRIIARAYNQVEMLKDATAHAEMIVLTQAAAALGDWRLNEVDLYVTKEPCAMCAGACVNARIRHIYYGMRDSRCGGCEGALNLHCFTGMLWQCEVTAGVLESACRTLIQDFFAERRKAGKI